METIETAGNINNLEMNNLNDLELRLIENIELKIIYKLNAKINERDEKIDKLNYEICQLKEGKICQNQRNSQRCKHIKK